MGVLSCHQRSISCDSAALVIAYGRRWTLKLTLPWRCGAKREKMAALTNGVPMRSIVVAALCAMLFPTLALAADSAAPGQPLPGVSIMSVEQWGGTPADPLR